MEPAPKYPNTFEQISRALDGLIKDAKTNAIPDGEYNREDDGNGKYEKAKIYVKTLPEFRLLLEKIGMPYEKLIDSLQHENAHGNKADELGAVHDGYNLLCLKYNGGYGYIPQVGINIPDEWPQEKQDRILNEIYRAPEEFGNSMSPDDIEDLK